MEFLLQLLLALAVLFLLARLGSAIVSRFGLPGLIGEIVIGIVVANIAFGDWSLLGSLGITMPEPGTGAEEGSDVYHIIYAMAELGVVFLLFTVGLETKVKDLLGSGRPALLCAILGVILPFIAGFAIIMMYDGNMNHALFLAAAMVATSVGITARIIKDLRLMDTKEARIIIAAAVIDDVLGMIVLAIVNGMAASGELSIGNIASITLQAVVFVMAIRYRNTTMFLLSAVQLAVSIWCGSFALHPEDAMAEPMYIDTLSVIMVLIVGLVGSAICIYALGYMKDFQHHEEEAARRAGTKAIDRRHQFIALMFLFLSAMFIIVTSDNFDWLVAGWEITTVCSFLMIGYTRTPEAKKSAILQINLNMVGGLAFHVALVVMHTTGVPLSINGMVDVAAGAQADLLIMPLMLLSVAGLTKAAQMPFHQWLLGAMVAPTPTSALLHSSTMVKAGVFLLVKLAPLYLVYPIASAMVVAVGGVTFVLCSFMAISQSNAKRVLAYSTIANLGLISACAGVGTSEAVWAAIFLIIFHTVSKSVLFLCVGTVEHRIGSRNIEDMDGLFSRLPRLTRFMMLGIMGMFVAPFGMLISKWATLVSFAETGNVLFLILLAFGSAATFFFWAKWLGKLAGVSQKAENVEGGVHKSEWTAIGFISALLVLCCTLLPVISQFVIGPYLEVTYNKVPRLIDLDNMLIMVVIVLFIAIVLLTPWGRFSKARQHVYLSGVCLDADSRTYLGSMGRTMRSTKRNWYLADVFPEHLLTLVGQIICGAGLLMAFAACFIFHVDMLAGGTFLVEREVMLVGPGLLGIAAGCVVFGLPARRPGPQGERPHAGPRGSALAAALLRRAQAAVQGADERQRHRRDLRHLRAHLLHPGRRHVHLRLQPAFVRVPRDACHAVRDHRRVLLALPVGRCRRGPRVPAGHVLRAHAAHHDGGLLHRDPVV